MARPLASLRLGASVLSFCLALSCDEGPATDLACVQDFVECLTSNSKAGPYLDGQAGWYIREGDRYHFSLYDPNVACGNTEPEACFDPSNPPRQFVLELPAALFVDGPLDLSHPGVSLKHRAWIDQGDGSPLSQPVEVTSISITTVYGSCVELAVGRTDLQVGEVQYGSFCDCRAGG